MFGLGMPEILLILALALIIIGPKKLPDLAKTLGRAMGEFKRSAQDFKRSIDIETTVKDIKDVETPVEEIRESIKNANIAGEKTEPFDDSDYYAQEYEDTPQDSNEETIAHGNKEDSPENDTTAAKNQEEPKKD